MSKCVQCGADCYSDDQLPITEEWLLSVGFEKVIHWPSIVSEQGEVFTYQHGSLWADEKRLVRVNHRGQLRLLARALGVELKESK